MASRGLDIPGVKHVIHYQIPRSAEIYVHRSGRTARLSKEGLSVMLVSPDEMNLYNKIIKTFKNGNYLTRVFGEKAHLLGFKMDRKRDS